MRKLTGYIGAMIIVIALMGSILAGYALNINGTSTVMNEYEKITDVSGLYTHTQEPSYIDYNPASNYIGYNVEQSDSFTITNTPSTGANLLYQLYTTPVNGSWQTYQYNTGAYYDENGAVVPYSTPNNQYGFYAYNIMVGDNFRIWRYLPDNTAQPIATDLWINGVFSRNWGTNVLMVFDGQNATINIDNGAGIFTVPTNYVIVPKENGNYAPIFNTGIGYYTTGLYSTPEANVTINNVNEWNNQTVFNLYSVQISGSDNWAFVPKTVDYQPIQDIGINYTESNRVNNYLMETTDTTISYYSGSINMATLGAPDQFYYNSYGTKQIINGYYLYASNRSVTGEIDVNSYPRYSISVPASQPAHDSIYDSNNPNWYYDGWHNVKLSNVLASFNAPANTKSIKITTDSIYGQYFSSPNVTIDKNLVWFSYLPNLIQDYGSVPSLNSEMNKKDYLIFDVANNLATVYTYDGTTRYSGSPDDIGIFYYTNGTTYKGLYSWRNEGSSYTSYIFYDMNDRPAPTIKLTATVATPGTLKYADITKGYAIKSNNVSDVIWNNNYQNGNVQLLFRAENTPGTYHNGLIVGDNNISIDYNTNRYLVTLNGGDPVDIGTWRNIILDIDLINGELSVIPVRTFNSFTNVETDNTNIFIGDLINPTPTNIIKWVPTTNSLMFNIYSTSVFMNTYGIVMVNPVLNITDYFTDLDNFYQLKISNISVVGQSMTVNDITGIVTGNTITFNDETIQIKDMAITYADGHTYISDSHVSIDLGEIRDNNISMSGAWYFTTDLMRGYTAQKMMYEWDWQDFILDNVQFCIIYIGLALIGLLIARHYCTLTITDYALFLVSIVIALTVQVIA